MNHLRNFFFLNLSDYESIAIQFPLGAFLCVLTAALIAGAFILNARRSRISLLCKRLLQANATSQESAVSLTELRLGNSRIIRSVLKKSSELRSYVKMAGEVLPTYEEFLESEKAKRKRKKKAVESNTLADARFYILSQKLEIAKARAAEDNSIIKPIALSIILIAILIGSAFLFPWLLKIINEALK